MKIENVLGDNIGFIELVDSMGSDLTIVDSARVSFGKRSDWKYNDEVQWNEDKSDYTIKVGVSRELKKKDKILVDYLAENKHWSPFRHIQMQFHVKAPEIVARQFFRHLIGCEYTSKEGYKDTPWNECSQRYAEWKDEFYVPSTFRVQSKDNKQASEGELTMQTAETAEVIYKNTIKNAYNTYNELISLGVCKEQARGVLPVSFYTEWYITMSLQAVINFISLRDHDHAQQEIRAYAVAMKELAMSVAPEGVDALVRHM